MAYPRCQWCAGQGCISCEEERRKDEALDRNGSGAANAVLNLHCSDLKQVPAAYRKIQEQTGTEPVVCLHLYAGSLDELREMFQIERPVNGRRVSQLEKMLIESQNKHKLEAFLESSELREARAKLEQWKAHGSNYAMDQQRYWQREIARLEAERDGVVAPPDESADDDEGEDAEPVRVSAEDEELILKCLEVMRAERKASTSLFQRRLRLGYTRATQILDIMEGRGIVGPGEGAKPRPILVDLDAPPPPKCFT